MEDPHTTAPDEVDVGNNTSSDSIVTEIYVRDPSQRLRGLLNESKTQLVIITRTTSEREVYNLGDNFALMFRPRTWPSGRDHEHNVLASEYTDSSQPVSSFISEDFPSETGTRCFYNLSKEKHTRECGAPPSSKANIEADNRGRDIEHKPDATSLDNGIGGSIVPKAPTNFRSNITERIRALRANIEANRPTFRYDRDNTAQSAQKDDDVPDDLLQLPSPLDERGIRVPSTVVDSDSPPQNTVSRNHTPLPGPFVHTDTPRPGQRIAPIAVPRAPNPVVEFRRQDDGQRGRQGRALSLHPPLRRDEAAFYHNPRLFGNQMRPTSNIDTPANQAERLEGMELRLTFQRVPYSREVVLVRPVRPRRRHSSGAVLESESRGLDVESQGQDGLLDDNHGYRHVRPASLGPEPLEDPCGWHRFNAW